MSTARAGMTTTTTNPAWRVAARLSSYKKQSYWTLKEAVHYRYSRSNSGVWQALADMPRYSSASDRAFYCDSFDGFREVGNAGECSRDRHTGWYTTIWQDETVIGVVLQMPARGGKPRYFPAVKWSDCDGVTLYPLDVYEEKEAAARAADHIAERIAEEEREFSAKDAAEQEIESLREEIVTSRTERRELVAEMKQQDRTAARPAICAALRSQLATLKRQSRKAYKRIQALTENPWEVAPHG